MVRVSATEAKVHLGMLLDQAADQGQDVVIESRGRARAVLMGYDQYLHLQTLKELERRRQALERLEALAVRVSSRNRDLEPTDAEALANRFAREVASEVDVGSTATAKD